MEWIVDLLMGLTLTALAVGSVLVPDPLDARQYPPPDVWLVALAVLSALPLVLRRRFPASVFVVSLSSWLTIWILGWNSGVVPACTLFALYAAAAYQPLRRSIPCLVLLLGGASTAIVLESPELDSLPLELISLVGFGLVWGGGLSMRRIRKHQQAAAQRALEAERTRAAMAERAVFAERLRIARELHDVVSHTLSIITVQSGVARHLLGSDHPQAGSALTAIEEAGRAALDDLRRMLGILRTGPGDQASLVPSPGLDELELLVSTHRVADGPVRLELDPAVNELPESVRTTVFRIVQEGLTNVRKHAAGASVRIEARVTREALVVEVANAAPPTGQGERSNGPGFGLAGMRERVGVFEGALEAGPDGAGGYRLRVVLPFRGPEPADGQPASRGAAVGPGVEGRR